MTSREDAVSEVIGGVLLIALVMIGAALVGTYIMSQPLPEKIPKVQFSVKQAGDDIYLEHEGGESLGESEIDIVVDGVRIPHDQWDIKPSPSRWQMGDQIKITGHGGASGESKSVGLVYSGGSGETLLRSSSSPWGFNYVFPSFDPSEVVDVPRPFGPAGEYGDLAWQFPSTGDPQPLFAPANGKHVFVAAKEHTMAVPAGVDRIYQCDETDDEREINDALAYAQGGIVELSDGNFRCHGRIPMPDQTTLRGQGSLLTTVEITANGGSGYLPIKTEGEYINIVGFTMRGNAFVMVTRSHVRVNDVRATCIDLDGNWHTASGNGMFFVWVAPPVNVIDDVEFYECHVVWAHTHGFNMNQDYNDGVCRATTNIRFLNCRAVGCGYGRDEDVSDPTVTATNQSRSEWITGFDFHEWQDLVNLEVVNCVASDNWESGFHLEPGARYSDDGGDIGPRTVSQNIHFRNCISSNNGQRNTYASHFFMSGYYLSRDTHLVDCQSLNNRNAGYYVHGGADSSFERCTDDGSTYGWKVCKASEEITLTNCTSANNLRWALWLSFSQGIRVTNFVHTNVVGDRGYQNILGWYKDEAKYQQPVTDSFFEIRAVGNGIPIINEAGSGNTYVLSYG